MLFRSVDDAAEAFRTRAIVGARLAFAPADLGRAFALAEVELYGNIVLRFVTYQDYQRPGRGGHRGDALRVRRRSGYALAALPRCCPPLKLMQTLASLDAAVLSAHEGDHRPREVLALRQAAPAALLLSTRTTLCLR